MSCEHDCRKPPVFPRTIFNRPGLKRIDYRIGSYAEMREHMFDLLDKEPMLAAWTHRAPDDPGIALIESAAIVGDILTFYQRLYANELYLRTAEWRESVAELVRLLGYRLAPGLGGEATFALAVKGGAAVTVPKGFGLKAQLEGQDKPAEFESVEEKVVYPWLGQFNLFRPMHTPYITGATKEFYIFSPDQFTSPVEIKKGDRLFIGDPYPSTNPVRFINGEIVVIDDVRELHGAKIYKIKGNLKRTGSVFEINGFKLGRSLRHFGHNAPGKTVSIGAGGVASETTVTFVRNLNSDAPGTALAPDGAKAFPLDTKVNDFSVGGTIICQSVLRFQSGGITYYSVVNFALIRTIQEIRQLSYTWGSMTGSSTTLILNDKLTTTTNPAVDTFYDPSKGALTFNLMDIREAEFHEAVSPLLTLRAAYQESATVSGHDLYFYGTDAQAQALANQKLFLAKEGEETQSVTVQSVQTLSPSYADRPLLRSVTLDTEVQYADFPNENPIVTAYGNLISATQGKTQDEVVLGSGDQRQIFQTFAVPKAPLTYLLDETQTPAQVPELHVYVDGIEWQRVDSFFNALPDEAVYVVREDEEGKSYVQFGDGKTGRRLTSGLKNVTAVFRVGQGAYGELKPGTNPSATTKLNNFDKLFLPAPATGGSAPEEGDNACVAAPGKMQSLGRIVSLADVEAEALAIPHVIKVRAVWSAPEGFPIVRLTVLTESGSTADLEAVAESMRSFNRCRGPARYPIDVVQGIRQYVYINVEAGYEPERREADVIAAIKQALGLAGEEGDGIDGSEGLFGLKTRRFGQGAHKSQIIGAGQNAAGVRWVKLKAAEIISLGTPPENDPTELAKPGVDYVGTVLACPDDRLLALHTLHFTISLSKDEVAEECEA